MTRKMLATLLGMFLLFPSARALATGIGPYVEYGFGFHSIKGSVDDEGDFDEFDDDVDSDADHFGVGFMLDTAVARDSLFNYRLAIGYQKSWIDPENSPNFDGVQANGFSLNNTFGFGVVRTEAVRFWLGPAIRITVDLLDQDWGNEDRTNVDVLDVGVGIGPQMGININPADPISIVVSCGYQYIFVMRSVNVDSDFEAVDEGGDDSFLGQEHLFFVNAALLFRLGDDKF